MIPRVFCSGAQFLCALICCHVCTLKFPFPSQTPYFYSSSSTMSSSCSSLSFKRSATTNNAGLISSVSSSSVRKEKRGNEEFFVIHSRLQYMTADGGRRQKLEEALKEEIPSAPGLSKNTQIALTKELLKNRFGRRCPELLATEFVYDACYEKPKNKEEYLEFFANMNLQGGFPNSDYELLYDSMRVEWDTKVRQQQYKVW